MPANQLFSDWTSGDLITAAKLNQMKNDLAVLNSPNFSGTPQIAGVNIPSRASWIDHSTSGYTSSIPADTSQAISFGVTGAALGDFVTVSISIFGDTDMEITGRVVAANTVDVVYHNNDTSAQSLGAHTLYVRVHKRNW